MVVHSCLVIRQRRRSSRTYFPRCASRIRLRAPMRTPRPKPSATCLAAGRADTILGRRPHRDRQQCSRTRIAMRSDRTKELPIFRKRCWRRASCGDLRSFGSALTFARNSAADRANSQVPKAVLAREPAEYLGGARFKLAHHREADRAFRDIDFAGVSRPLVHVLKIAR